MAHAPDTPPPPPPAPALRVTLSPLESLPGPLQTIVATMPPDGENRLRLCLVSRAMREHHRGTLTTLRVKGGPKHRIEALERLLERNKGLKRLAVRGGAAVSALVYFLAQGRLAHVQELTVECASDEARLALGHMRALAGALQVPGAL